MPPTRVLARAAVAGPILIALAATAVPAGARPVRGLTRAVSPLVAAPNNLVTQEPVSCPGGTVPLSGGPLMETRAQDVTIAGSFPTATGWVTRVGNRSGAANRFEVRVVCAKLPRRYVVVHSAPTLVPAVQTGHAEAVCPRG